MVKKARFSGLGGRAHTSSHKILAKKLCAKLQESEGGDIKISPGRDMFSNRSTYPYGDTNPNIFFKIVMKQCLAWSLLQMLLIQPAMVAFIRHRSAKQCALLMLWLNDSF